MRSNFQASPRDGVTFQARLLRERLGFRGEIRALRARRDHLRFMERCGFDAFELADGEEIPQALAAFEEVRVDYQPATR
ncbi:MAG: DUF934 domain-containing protein [Gammaproteobacteria bacterium]|nr:DUF934 domain-containing protein [Gammaproteobacteria bacterium]